MTQRFHTTSACYGSLPYLIAHLFVHPALVGQFPALSPAGLRALAHCRADKSELIYDRLRSPRVSLHILCPLLSLPRRVLVWL